MQKTKVGYRYSLEGELNELIINKIQSECRLIVGGGVLFLERCDCSARLIKSLFLLNRLFREFFMYLHQLKNDIAVLAITLITLPVLADDWPQWRGPNRDAKSSETGLLQVWPVDGPPLKWQTDSLGEGNASVVMAIGRLHTIGNEAGTIFAYGLSEETGEILWKTRIGESSRHAMSTPTVDGDYLYALDPDGELACLHVLTGEIQWQVDFIRDYGGKLQSGRGFGESPLIDGKYLICTPGGDEAIVVALNKATGELVWKTAAPTVGDKGGDGAAFSSIVKARIGEIDMYVQLVGRGLIGIECRGGRYLWGYNDICADIVNIPTPVIQDDYVFSANGYNSGSVLLQLKPVGAKEIDVHEVYRLAGNQFQNHHGGVVALNGKIFGGHGSNNGLPTCVDFQSGKVLWKRRGPGVGSAAVVYADNRFVFRYQNGVVALLSADKDGFTIEGKFQIPGAGGDSWSHPVIANGALFLREQNSLYVHNLDDDGDAEAEMTTEIASVFTEDIKWGLNQLGVEHSSVGQLQQHSSTFDIEQFYSYVVDQTDINAVGVIPVVSLKPNEDDEFAPEVINILKKASHDFVVDLTGLKLNARQIQQVEQLSHMKGMDLQFCTGLSSEVLDLVGQIEGLRALRLAGTDVSNESIELITKLSSLQSLDLEVCENISDVALPKIVTMTELRCLILKKTAFEKLKITDKGVANLSQLPKLEVLSLYGNRVTDVGMQSISQLSALRVLDLSLVGIKDKGVATLAPLEQLEELYLLHNTGFAGPILTDQAVQTIKGFTNLRQLSLVGAKVSNESVESLSGLKKLERLQLQYSRIDAEGIRVIQEALPDLSITK